MAKRSIFQGLDGEGISAQNKALAASAIDDAKRQFRSTSKIPVNQIEEDLVPLSDGSFKKISPRKIAEQTLFIINTYKAIPKYSFLKSYLEKPVIWTYEAKTAFTDGIRIFMSPIFAAQLLKHGKSLGDEWLDEQTKKNPLFMDKQNKGFISIAGKLIMFVIVHECYHVLYLHIKRERLLIGKDPVNHTKANIAADLEINRDIESCFSELAGSTNIIGGVWWEDPTFAKKNGELFRRDVFETILRYMLDNDVDMPENAMDSPFNDPNSGNNSNDMSNTTYGKGWDKAIAAIQNKEINPEDIDFI